MLHENRILDIEKNPEKYFWQVFSSANESAPLLPDYNGNLQMNWGLSGTGRMLEA